MAEPVPEGHRPGSARKPSILKRGLATIIGLLIGVTLAEGTVRVFTLMGTSAGTRLAARDPLGTIYEPYGNFGYRPKAGRVERFSNGTFATYNARRYRGPLVSIEKPHGTFRVVILGGSTAVGYGARDDETIDAYLRRFLAAGFPEICIDVVNLGLGGYDSYQEYERLRVEGVPLRPDVVIVHSGINDVRHARFAKLGPPPDHRTLIWESALGDQRKELITGPSLWTLSKHYSYLARLPGFVSELTQQRRTLTALVETVPHPAAAEYFETNVMNIVRLAEQAGAAVILSTPPSALSFRNKPSDPVEKSYWIKDAGTTEAYRDSLAQRLRGIAAREHASGARVSYLSYRLPLEQFLDDAHLLGPGNATVARALADSVAPYVRTFQANQAGARAGCPRS